MVKKREANINQVDTVIEWLRKNIITVVIILAMAIFGASLISKNSGNKKITITQNEKKSAQIEEASSNKYKIKAGDNLWKIAEQKYGSGYNFVDIAKANKIKNPDVILIGQELTIPQVKKKTPTTGDITATNTSKVTLAGDQYKVQKGDYLWKIAVAAYGDGYQWPKIAKENNIINPDIIYPAQTIKLPR